MFVSNAKSLVLLGRKLQMKHKNNINVGVKPETHKLVKELQLELGVKSLDEVIVYLLENVE